MRYVRRARKYAKKIGKRIYRKAIKPYVNKKKGYKNRMKLYNEINQIKRVINAEKKYKDQGYSGVSVAQLLNGSDGVYVNTITPTLALGTAYNERTGNSVRLASAYVRLQFTAQTNTINKIKFRVTLFKAVGLPQTTTQLTAGMYDINPISAVRDFFAPRNPNQFTDYRIIGTRQCVMYPDSITGQTGITDMLIPIKLGHHLRYSTAGVIQEGEVFIMIQADYGDAGTPLTGCFCTINSRMWYYDN